MQVILLVDDKKLGKKDAIVTVADSYARNVLIPKKIAVQATADNIRQLDVRLAKEARNHAEQLAMANELETRLTGETEFIWRVDRVGIGGKLFGAVTAKDIVSLLKQHGISIDKKNVALVSPIKAVGSYTVNITLYGGKVVPTTVKVISC